MLSFAYLPSELITEQLSARVKALRLVRNLTQPELAARAGMSFRTVSRFERGETISLDNFVKLLSALNRSRDLESILLLDDTIPVGQYEQTQKTSKRQRARSRRP